MRFILGFVLIFFSLSSLASQRLIIQGDISMKPGKVYLKDVSRFSGFTDESLKVLNEIVLSSDLKQGEMRKFSDQVITDILRKKLNKIKRAEREAGKEFSLILKLPKMLKLFVSSPKWDRKSIGKQIINANQKHCASCNFKLESIILPNVKHKSISSWKIDIPQEFIKGRFQIPLIVKRHGSEKAQKYYISGNIIAFRKMPVARRNLAPGDRVTENDILWEQRKWNYIRKDFPRESELVGAKAKRTIISGGILWLSNLEREKAIQRGDLVDIIVKRSNWVMRLKGVAQRSGMLGDTVPVLNRKSKKVLMGKVVDNQKVELR